MRVSAIKSSFNAGEVSPFIQGRVDLEKYGSACDIMRNFIPTVQGAAINRPGTKFVAEVKDSTKYTWLAEFKFNFQQSFILEFSPGKLRFYINRGILLSGPTPYEINTPFTEAMLTSMDGTFGLSMVQSGDVIYITHRSLPPYKLTRLGNTNWTLAPIEFGPEPFGALNNIYLSSTILTWDGGSPGLVNSNNAYFRPEQVGRQLYLAQPPDLSTFGQWQSNTAYGSGSIVFNGLNLYVLVDPAGTSGYVPPINNTRGSIHTDGFPGVKWLYINSGFAYFRITGYVSPTQVNVVLIPQNGANFPNILPTPFFASSDWSDNNFPTHVTFFRDRLVFARDQTVWMSRTGLYEDFSYTPFGEQTADSAMNIPINTEQSGQVTYLFPGTKGLIAGTTENECIVTENTTADPFGPGNVKSASLSGYGGKIMRPIRVDDMGIFVQRGGKKLREMRFNFDSDSFVAPDITTLANHILKESIAGAVQMAMAREPYSNIWIARSDGVLVGLTYNKEQEVQAFHQHYLGDSDLFVESVASIASPNGLVDDLWMVVRVVVNGVTKRYVCYMEQEYVTGAAQNTSFYVDAGATYSGAPTITITGLGYLEGKTVTILADGASHPTRVVTGGQITLDSLSSVVHVGLGYTPIIRFMNIEAQTKDGTAQGKLRQVGQITLRLQDTAGIKVGVLSNEDDIYQELYNPDPNPDKELKFVSVNYRDAQNLMDNPPPLFTGDTRDTLITDTYTKDSRLVIAQPLPLPAKIIAAFPQVIIHDKD